MVVNLGIEFHHLVEIVVMETSGDEHSQGVANEMQRMVVFHQSGVLGEQRALLRFLYVGLQFGEPVLAGKHENIIEYFESFQIERPAAAAALKNLKNTVGDSDNGRYWVGDQHGTVSSATNDQQLRWLNMHHEVAVCEQAGGIFNAV